MDADYPANHDTTTAEDEMTKVRIQTKRDGRWVACGSLTFTLRQGQRLIESSLYGAGTTRLVQVGTGEVLYVKPCDCDECRHGETGLGCPNRIEDEGLTLQGLEDERFEDVLEIDFQTGTVSDYDEWEETTVKTFTPKDREAAYEASVSALELRFEKAIEAAANRGAAAHERDGYDSAHDAAKDAVEAVLFASELWSHVEATDISDIAYEAATRATRELLPLP